MAHFDSHDLQQISRRHFERKGLLVLSVGFGAQRVPLPDSAQDGFVTAWNSKWLNDSI